VFAEKDALAGKPVAVRGKVVKVNSGIMGKTWIHVRDGSGAEGTSDLTVTTTTAQPNVGDTVLVTGPVSRNKDFGMGYQYDVIVEDAQVTVETTATL
jgi:RecJ-like exonuclease